MRVLTAKARGLMSMSDDAPGTPGAFLAGLQVHERPWCDGKNREEREEGSPSPAAEVVEFIRKIRGRQPIQRLLAAAMLQQKGDNENRWNVCSWALGTPGR